jgi:hypothetical protein
MMQAEQAPHAEAQGSRGTTAARGSQGTEALLDKLKSPPTAINQPF